VSILRAGETMEQAVCDVCKDIRIGKILIQTNRSTGEPEVCTELIIILVYVINSNCFHLALLSTAAKRY
jgi:uracil phosphoribosyltransferase